MPWGLRRYQNSGTLHFITFSCYRRQPLLMKHGAAQMFVASTRRSADKAWLLCLRLCRHARARPPVGERTRTRPFGHSDQSSQTVRRPATGKSRLRSPIIPTKRPTQAKAAWVGHPHERTGRIATRLLTSRSDSWIRSRRKSIPSFHSRRAYRPFNEITNLRQAIKLLSSMPRLWHANCSVRAVSPLSADLALAEEAGFASGGDFDLNWSEKLRPSNGSWAQALDRVNEKYSVPESNERVYSAGLSGPQT